MKEKSNWGLVSTWNRVRQHFKTGVFEPLGFSDPEIETFCRNLLAAWENEPVDRLPHRVRGQLPFARMALNRLNDKRRACEAGKTSLAGYYDGLLAVVSAQLHWDGDFTRGETE